jgi:tetratricopeptide (TPR) repeat protein
MNEVSSPPVAASGPTKHVCDECGATTPCACADVHQSVTQKWGALVEAGMASAGARRFRSAIKSLEEADGLKELLAPALVAFGLCHMATGDVAGAASTWGRVAEDSDSHAKAAHLLRLVQSEEVKSALDAYSRAVAIARSGNGREALDEVRRCRAILPDLIHAARLELLLTPSGDEQRDIARSLLKQFPDDSELLISVSTVLGTTSRLQTEMSATANPVMRAAPRKRLAGFLMVGLVGVGFGALITLAVRSPAPQRSVALVDSARTTIQARSEPPRLTKPNETVERSVLQLALSEKPSDLANLKAAMLADPVPFSLAQVGVLDRRLEQAARQAYSRGRLLLSRGDTTAAIPELRDASKASANSYLTDDALYLLALLLESQGDAGEATVVAEQLLAQHPTSMYRNSTIQRIASRRTVTTP